MASILKILQTHLFFSSSLTLEKVSEYTDKHLIKDPSTGFDENENLVDEQLVKKSLANIYKTDIESMLLCIKKTFFALGHDKSIDEDIKQAILDEIQIVHGAPKESLLKICNNQIIRLKNRN
jgi:hypothetical protein